MPKFRSMKSWRLSPLGLNRIKNVAKICVTSPSIGKPALAYLTQFKLPIEQSISDLAQLEWGSEIELLPLEAAQIQNALQLFAQEAISASEVETWANAIECRDDIKI
jgi:hypothetical protein